MLASLVTDPRRTLCLGMEAASGEAWSRELRGQARLRRSFSRWPRNSKRSRAWGRAVTENDDVELTRLSGAEGVTSVRKTVHGARAWGTDPMHCNVAPAGRGSRGFGRGRSLGWARLRHATKPGMRSGGLPARVTWSGMPVLVRHRRRHVRDGPGGSGGRAPGFAVVRAVLDAEDPESAARELRSFLTDAPRNRALV